MLDAEISFQEQIRFPEVQNTGLGDVETDTDIEEIIESRRKHKMSKTIKRLKMVI